MTDGARLLQDLLEREGPVMVSTHDVEGRYLAASDQARDLLGREPADLVGRSAYDLHHPDDLRAIQTSHVTLLATTQVILVDYRIRHADGHYVPVRTIGWSERDPSATPVHLVVLTAPRTHLSDDDVAALQRVPVETVQRVAEAQLA